jgi:hypothetical protein
MLSVLLRTAVAVVCGREDGAAVVYGREDGAEDDGRGKEDEGGGYTADPLRGCEWL